MKENFGWPIAAFMTVAVLLSGCGGLMNLTAPGEIGDVINYGARILVVDDRTDRELEGVQIVIKDGPHKVVAELTTDEAGRAAFVKQYHLRRPRHYGKNVGYPDNFLVVCGIDGYRTLQQTVPGNNFLVDDKKGSPRHVIRLQVGIGIVKQKL